MRRIVQILVGAGILAIISQTWLVEGLITPIVVSGGSMAPTLLGQHRLVTCGDCEYQYTCGEEFLPTDMQAICPNCGATNDLSTLPVRSPNRLIIDRTAYSTRHPERFEMAVLALPMDSPLLGVKRIVGLPGEMIEIRDGDIYVDHQIVRKSLDQLLAVAIVVHDSKHSSRSSRPHWQGKSPETSWREMDTGYECNNTSDAIDWLEYQHQQTFTHGNVVRRPGPILDELGYNQNESRQLIEARDVVLRGRLRILDGTALWLRANDGRRQFDLRIDFSKGQGDVLCDQKILTTFSCSRLPIHDEQQFVLALADAQLQLAWNGQLLVTCPYDPAGVKRATTLRPLAIGSQGLRMQISRLEVLRDLHYLEALGKPSEPRQLSSDEYFVLGDNSAISDDSRTWSETLRITDDVLVGKVLGHR